MDQDLIDKLGRLIREISPELYDNGTSMVKLLKFLDDNFEPKRLPDKLTPKPANPEKVKSSKGWEEQHEVPENMDKLGEIVVTRFGPALDASSATKVISQIIDYINKQSEKINFLLDQQRVTRDH